MRSIAKRLSRLLAERQSFPIKQASNGAMRPTSPPPPSPPPRFADGELDWIEKCGTENLKERVELAGTLAEEASKTLTLLLAGVGASLAYSTKAFDGQVTHTTAAAIAACIWLMGVSAYLVFKCLWVSPIPPIFSQPALLLQRERHASFEAWRHGELLNLEDRIQRAIKRNKAVARHLNRARALAVATPLVTLLATSLFFSTPPWVVMPSSGLAQPTTQGVPHDAHRSDSQDQAQDSR